MTDVIGIEYYKTLAHVLIDNDGERDSAFDAYSDMYHCDWELPKETKDVPWIRKVVSTDPHDAIIAGTRVISNTPPKIRKMPLVNNAETRAEANLEEKNLMWQLKSANRRRSRTVVADMAESSLLYQSIACMVIDLDWQIKQAKARGRDTKTMEQARRVSRFAVEVHAPKNVHVRRSVFGVETVVLCETRKAIDVVSEHPHMREEMKTLVENDQSVNYYDIMDATKRAIWCEPADVATTDGGHSSTSFTIEDLHDHGLEFFPWVALMGGSSVEEKEEDKYHPMLYPLWRTGNWDTQNLAKSLYMSEIIAGAGQARTVEEGSNPQKGDGVDHADPARTAHPAPGNVLKPLPAQYADPALADIDDRMAASIEKATVSRILQGGEAAAGTAFASLNLMTQTAIGALTPAKELTQKALVEVFTLFLYWAHYTNNGLVGYTDSKRGESGDELTIKPDEIDPSAIYIEVELTPDAPTDRMQRANAASMMTQFGYPKVYALDDLGVEDPEGALRLWYLEQLQDTMVNLAIQQMESEQQMQLQQQATMMQMQLQQGMQAQQQAQQQVMQQNQQAQIQAQQQAQQMALQAAGGQGQGFNPAMGGISPNMAEPGMLERESVNNADMSGNQVGLE